MTHRPMASVSLDVDNLWSYMKTHGDPGWEARPTYLPTFSPMALEALDRLGIRITFFLVGVDASREENMPALRAFVTAGHEVGNHSFEHEPWLHLYSREELEREIGGAEEAIATATGQRPIGFRGPGFSWSPELLRVLSRRGYLYDASTFPTYLGPLARAYYFWTAKLSKEEREKRSYLFGSLTEGLRPNKPYEWDLGEGGRLLEIPVTTMPAFKLPFHFSYLLYLARYSASPWRRTCARRLPCVESPGWSLHSCSIRSTCSAVTRRRHWRSFPAWTCRAAGRQCSSSVRCASWASTSSW